MNEAEFYKAYAECVRGFSEVAEQAINMAKLAQDDAPKHEAMKIAVDIVKFEKISGFLKGRTAQLEARARLAQMDLEDVKPC
ncbi:MAG: hypothetical protein P4M15_09470 [Alphaproteobacteria bacterium]|nr:hypothetical protein [Alphaproteobacteria bacterium]